ncbi:Carbohydrate sulfotransferase 1 [Halotydeus destructor]|nr:Carbohydrate sulfotransferase 1 [Halotydeus destructor]
MIKSVSRVAIFLHALASLLLVFKYNELNSLNFVSLDNTSTEPNANVSKVLVVTYLRSGSTFLADLLQQNSKSFYTFEPLNYFDGNTNRIGDNATEPAFQLLNQLFDCKQSAFDLLQEKFPKSSRFKIARFYDELCSINSTNCDQPESLRAACEKCKFRVLKVVRLNLKQLAAMLESHPEMVTGLRVVHSRRDPRGIFNSRRTRPWCQNGTQCGSIEQMCSEIRQDLDMFQVLSSKYPRTFVSVRFEELALDSLEQSKMLYKNIGLPWTKQVEQFINRHTKVKYDTKLTKHPYSTFRNSRTIPYAWVSQLRWPQIDFIQKQCYDVINRLGYKLITQHFYNQSDDFQVDKVINFDY